MDEELQALLEQILASGLAEDQQAILGQQMQEALRNKHAEMPQAQHAGGLMFSSGIGSTIGTILRNVLGGKGEQAVRGTTPTDPNTGLPITQYGNLATSQQGVRSQLQQKIADYLRQKKAAPAFQPPEDVTAPVMVSDDWGTGGK